jgi:P-aminobenzoate N-oxygenase AurF
VATSNAHSGRGTPTKPQREDVSARLLGGSVKRSYMPIVDIDWDAPLEQDKFFIAPKTVSLYGTTLWDEMSHSQRVELSRQEFVNMLSTAIWFENVINQSLLRYALRQDPTTEETHYTLTEMGDETRHMVMFGKAIRKVGGQPVPLPRIELVGLNVLPLVLRGSLLWIMALLGEDITDELQRQMIDDDDLQPLAERILRIHIIEEARHISFARDGLRNRVANMSKKQRVVIGNLLGVHGILNQQTFTTPELYRRAGLADSRLAQKTAIKNPYYRAVQQRSFAHLATFFEDLGLMGAVSRRIWKHIGYLP